MKINSYLSLLCMLVSLQAFAEKKEHHAGMSAHEHGTLTLEVAVEGKKTDLEIEAPAENFLGFEYAPNQKKIKKLSQAHKTFGIKISLQNYLISINTLVANYSQLLLIKSWMDLIVKFKQKQRSFVM